MSTDTDLKKDESTHEVTGDENPTNTGQTENVPDQNDLNSSTNVAGQETSNGADEGEKNEPNAGRDTSVETPLAQENAEIPSGPGISDVEALVKDDGSLRVTFRKDGAEQTINHNCDCIGKNRDELTILVRHLVGVQDGQPLDIRFVPA